MSMKCPFCRAEIPEDSYFCDQCGKELRFCPDCGKPKLGTQCAACGSDLISAEEFFKAGKDDSGTLFLVSDSTRIELREGVFGRTQGVYPEFSVDRYISGRHGEFRRNGDVWQVRDLGSTNGTYIAGRRLETGVWTDLVPGQDIKIAISTFKLSL